MSLADILGRNLNLQARATSVAGNSQSLFKTQENSSTSSLLGLEQEVAPKTVQTLVDAFEDFEVQSEVHTPQRVEAAEVVGDGDWTPVNIGGRKPKVEKKTRSGRRKGGKRRLLPGVRSKPNEHIKRQWLAYVKTMIKPLYNEAPRVMSREGFTEITKKVIKPFNFDLVPSIPDVMHELRLLTFHYLIPLLEREKRGFRAEQDLISRQLAEAASDPIQKKPLVHKKNHMKRKVDRCDAVIKSCRKLRPYTKTGIQGAAAGSITSKPHDLDVSIAAVSGGYDPTKVVHNVVPDHELIPFLTPKLLSQLQDQQTSVAQKIQSGDSTELGNAELMKILDQQRKDKEKINTSLAKISRLKALPGRSATPTKGVLKKSSSLTTSQSKERRSVSLQPREPTPTSLKSVKSKKSSSTLEDMVELACYSPRMVHNVPRSPSHEPAGMSPPYVPPDGFRSSTPHSTSDTLVDDEDTASTTSAPAVKREEEVSKPIIKHVEEDTFAPPSSSPHDKTVDMYSPTSPLMDENYSPTSPQYQPESPGQVIASPAIASPARSDAASSYRPEEQWSPVASSSEPQNERTAPPSDTASETSRAASVEATSATTPDAQKALTAPIEVVKREEEPVQPATDSTQAGAPQQKEAERAPTPQRKTRAALRSQTPEVVRAASQPKEPESPEEQAGPPPVPQFNIQTFEGDTSAPSKPEFPMPTMTSAELKKLKTKKSKDTRGLVTAESLAKISKGSKHKKKSLKSLQAQSSAAASTGMDSTAMSTSLAESTALESSSSDEDDSSDEDSSSGSSSSDSTVSSLTTSTDSESSGSSSDSDDSSSDDSDDMDTTVDGLTMATSALSSMSSSEESSDSSSETSDESDSSSSSSDDDEDSDVERKKRASEARKRREREESALRTERARRVASERRHARETSRKRREAASEERILRQLSKARKEERQKLKEAKEKERLLREQEREESHQRKVQRDQSLQRRRQREQRRLERSFSRGRLRRGASADEVQRANLKRKSASRARYSRKKQDDDLSDEGSLERMQRLIQDKFEAYGMDPETDLPVKLARRSIARDTVKKELRRKAPPIPEVGRKIVVSASTRGKDNKLSKRPKEGKKEGSSSSSDDIDEPERIKISHKKVKPERDSSSSDSEDDDRLPHAVEFEDPEPAQQAEERARSASMASVASRVSVATVASVASVVHVSTVYKRRPKARITLKEEDEDLPPGAEVIENPNLQPADSANTQTTEDTQQLQAAGSPTEKPAETAPELPDIAVLMESTTDAEVPKTTEKQTDAPSTAEETPTEQENEDTTTTTAQPPAAEDALEATTTTAEDEAPKEETSQPPTDPQPEQPTTTPPTESEPAQTENQKDTEESEKKGDEPKEATPPQKETQEAELENEAAKESEEEEEVDEDDFNKLLAVFSDGGGDTGNEDARGQQTGEEEGDLSIHTGSEVEGLAKRAIKQGKKYRKRVRKPTATDALGDVTKTTEEDEREQLRKKRKLAEEERLANERERQEKAIERVQAAEKRKQQEKESIEEARKRLELEQKKATEIEATMDNPIELDDFYEEFVSSKTVHITELQRPFTAAIFKAVLEQFGCSVKFLWLKDNKAEAYVQYETAAGATAVIEHMHGKKWPAAGKELRIEYADDAVFTSDGKLAVDVNKEEKERQKRKAELERNKAKKRVIPLDRLFKKTQGDPGPSVYYLPCDATQVEQNRKLAQLILETQPSRPDRNFSDDENEDDMDTLLDSTSTVTDVGATTSHLPPPHYTRFSVTRPLPRTSTMNRDRTSIAPAPRPSWMSAGEREQEPSRRFTVKFNKSMPGNTAE